MCKKICTLIDAVFAAGRQSVSMQRKLMLYLLCLALAVFAFVLLLLSYAGVLSSADAVVQKELRYQLHASQTEVHKRAESLSAQGIALSERLSRLVEQQLAQSGRTVADLNNDQEALAELQLAAYEPMYSALQIAGCSGVWFFLDATVNTGMPDAEMNRSGEYLRLANVTASEAVDPTVMLYRGAPEVARRNGLQLHNRWNLEFDLEPIREEASLLGGKVDRLADACYWTRRVHLADTWETAVLLCVPILDASGRACGLCGFEVSSLYFQLSFPAAETELGPISTVVVPSEQNMLALGRGLCGGGGFQLQEAGDLLLMARRGKKFTSYEDGTGGFIGLEQPLKAGSGRLWSVAVLLPRSYYDKYAAGSRRRLMLGFAQALILLLAAVYLLSRRYVKPIKTSLAALQSGQPGSSRSGLSEIDELLQFLAQQSRTPEIAQETLPRGITFLFDRFIENSRKLTAAERNIFRLYTQGHSIAEIPELTYASMSTVRKHNRSIYDKLGVTSRDEMMLYIDLLRRCGRLQEIEGIADTEAAPTGNPV